MLGVGKYMAENRTYLQERLYGGTIEHTLMFFLLFSFIGTIAIEAVYFFESGVIRFLPSPNIILFSQSAGRYHGDGTWKVHIGECGGIPSRGSSLDYLYRVFAEIQSTSLSNYLINRFILSVLLLITIMTFILLVTAVVILVAATVSHAADSKYVEIVKEYITVISPL